MTTTEVRELFAAVRVSVKPDRYRVVRVETGDVVGHGTRSKHMAEKEARGRNLMAATSGWCPMYRVTDGGPVLCGGAVPAYGVCPRVHEHVETGA